MSNIHNFKEGVETDTSEDAPKAPEGNTGTPSDIGNGNVGDNSRAYIGAAEAVREYDEHQSKIDEINQQAKEKAAVHRDAQKEILKTASDEFGIHKKDMKYDIRLAAQGRKNKAAFAALPEDRQRDVTKLKEQRDLFETKAA